MRPSMLRRAAAAGVLPAALLAFASPAVALDKPFVGQTTPFNGQTRGDPGTAIQAQVVLQNSGSPIDQQTLKPGTDIMVQPVDQATHTLLPPIDVQANIDGAGAAITITPARCLQLSTKYKITLLGGANGIHDTAGAPLIKKTWAFLTTPSGGSCAPPTSVHYSRSIQVPGNNGKSFTSVVVGPASGSSPTGKML